MQTIKIIWLGLLLIIPASLHGETLVEGGRTLTSHFYMLPDNGQSLTWVRDNKEQFEKRTFPGLPLQSPNLWIVVDFDFPEDKLTAQSLFIAALGSYSAWWDGEFIGHNGLPGISRDEEMAGDIESLLALPLPLTKKGKHSLTLRFSGHHNRSDQSYGMFWAYVTESKLHDKQRLQDHFFPLLMCGGLLLLSCYCLMHYALSQKQTSYLIFSLLSIAIVALFMTESWRALWGYPYHWHIPRLEAVLVLTSVVALLLVSFLLKLFRFKPSEFYTWLGLAGLLMIMLLLLFSGYDTTSLQIFLVSAGISVCVCVRAIVLKQRYAKSMLLGLLLLTAPVVINSHFYMEQYFFVSFGVLVSLMLYILSQSIVQQQRTLLQTQLTASRLELEMVKRNVQPHFILNTLTAVEEWIEESPKTAIQFVQALAEEFRNLAVASKETLIPLSQEVALCRAHLKVMEYRSQSQFSFVLNTPTKNLAVPPGTLLTVIENALTHNRYGHKQVIITCNVKLEKNRVFIDIMSPIAAKQHTTALNTGLGQQYLHARLNESFGSDWQHCEFAEDDNWVCRLRFPLIWPAPEAK